MKKQSILLLSLTLILYAREMSFGQTQIESELHKITGQRESTQNRYIDSLFQLTESINDEIITNKVDKVHNRYELLYITKNFEKVAQMYENGKPIVKSIKNKVTGITIGMSFMRVEI